MEINDAGIYPSRFYDDDLIHRAWKYLQRWDSQDRGAMRRLAKDEPHLYEAHSLYQNTRGSRWIYEAGVMADRSPEELGEYLNADPEMLQMYEDVFFDVRDALKHRGCIISNVLLPATSDGVIPNDPDFFWKTLAYHGGWDVVRAMWETGNMAPAARDFFQRTYAEQMVKQGWMAAHSLQVNNFNAVEVMNAAANWLRFEHEAGSAQSRDQAQYSLQALLSDIRIAVVGPHEQVKGEELRPLQLDAPPDREEVNDLPSARAIYEKAAKEADTEFEE